MIYRSLISGTVVVGDREVNLSDGQKIDSAHWNATDIKALAARGFIAAENVEAGKSR